MAIRHNYIVQSILLKKKTIKIQFYYGMQAHVRSYVREVNLLLGDFHGSLQLHSRRHHLLTVHVARLLQQLGALLLHLLLQRLCENGGQ